MKYYVKFLVCLSFLFSLVKVSAQQEMTMYFSPHIAQANQLNPSFINKQTILSAPSIAFNYGNSAFTYNQLLVPTDTGRTLSLNSALAEMKESNQLLTEVAIDYLAINFRTKGVYWNFRISQRLGFNFTYSNELVDFTWNGNANYIGEEIQVAPKITANAYSEFALGAAFELGKFTIGQRVKLLSGIAHVSSNNEKAILYTNDEYYQTSVHTNYELNTSGVEQLDGSLINPFNGFKNPGVAFDFGTSYQYDSNWNFSASVLDLGFITWKENNKNYKATGNASFNGLDLNEYFENDTLDIENYGDSLEDQFNHTEDNNNFRQSLIPKFYISAKRKINDKQEVGLLLYGRYFNRLQPAISAFYGIQLHQNIKLGTSLSFKNNTISNIGLNYAQMLGRTQIFVSTDNVLGPIMWRKTRNLNFRFGVNVYLGKKTGV